MVVIVRSQLGKIVFLLAGILLISGLMPKDARAAIAYVQSTNNYTTATVTTLSQAFNSNNAAGNFIIVWTRWHGGSRTAFVTDSAGNAYQSLSMIQTNVEGFRGQLFYARNIAGGANTVTLTLSGSINLIALDIHEFSGVDSINPVDAEFHANAAAGTTQPNSGSVTTKNAFDLLFGAAAAGADESPWTPDTDYGLLQSNARSGTEYAIATSTGSYSATFTIPVAADWVSQIVAFSPAKGGLQVGSRSDTLSTSQLSSTSNHTFGFTVNSPITGSSTLILALPGQFTYPGIAFVQGNFNSGSAVTSLATTFGSANTAGNLIVVSTAFTGAGLTAAISDSAGNLYATAVGPVVNGSINSQIWYAKNIAAGANTVTVTYSSASVSADIEIHEYSGADTNEPLDATSSRTGTGMSSDSGSVTTTVANELIFGFGMDVGGGVDAMTGTGFMLRELKFGDATEDKIAPSGGLYNTTFTYPQSVSWLALMATFKPASSSGINCGDVDVATSVQFTFNYPSCAATATAWGFAADAAGSKITLQAPLVSSANVYVATGTQITIKIGSNATVGQQGAHWITNPSAVGVYTISVGGSFNGSGNILVLIISAVTISATVAESLAFTVSSVLAVNCTSNDAATPTFKDTTATTISFGIISPNTFNQACQDLIVSTNAGNGYSVTVQESSAMKTIDGRFNIPDTTCDAGTCSEIASTAAAWSAGTHIGLGFTCFNQDNNQNCNSNYAGGTNFTQFANIAGGETPQQIMASSTPASVTGRVKYRLRVDNSIPAGAYSTLITYIITGTY